MKFMTGLVGLGVAAAAAAPVLGRVAFDRRVDREVQELARGVVYSPAAFIRLHALTDLPAPVRRYLEFAGVDGRPPIRFARLIHNGLFRTAPDRDWMPIEGEEYFSVEPPGFVWYATVRPVPLVTIRARDLYMSGRGNMLVKPMSLVTLANARGSEVDVSALLRFVAEAPWFPTALVPGEHVRWEAIDASSARITIRDMGLTASGVFHFDSVGRIVRFETQDRYQADGDTAGLRPWGGTYRGYADVDGFRIPAEAEVKWLGPPEPFAYARFELQRIEYDVFGRF